jgi:hypothetical protein
MNIAICSAFRSASAYIDRYFEQVSSLHKALKKKRHTLVPVLGEGDSTDDTRSKLRDALDASGLGGFIVDCTHGGRDYGSVVAAERFKNLAYVGNKIFSAIPDDVAIVVWVESDLIWETSTLVALIDRLKEYPMVAPMIMEESTKGFYDLYAFRKDGVNFKKHPPYFDGWPVETPIQLDSIGSCWAMNATLARHVSFPAEDVVVGLCREIYEQSGSIFLDPSLIVYHS